MKPDELRRLVEWVLENDRPETGGRLLVPGLPPETPAVGPNIPLIGAFEAVERPSGIIVPRPRDPVPGDFYKPFATSSELLGERLSLEVVKEYLSQMPYVDLFGKIAALNCYLEYHGFESSPRLLEIIQATCPPDLWIQVRPHIDSGGVFASPQGLLTLIKLVLAHGAEGLESIHERLVGPLVLATNDHVAGTIGMADPRWTLELARYGLFYDRDSHMHHWGRAQLIWRELIPAMPEDPEFVDVVEVVEAATGVPFDTYIAMGVAYAAYFHSAVADLDKSFWVRLDSDVGIVPANHIRAFFLSLSEERAWFREQVSDETLYWDFTPFRLRPLLRVGETVAPFSLQLLLERTTDGLFYTVMDRQRDLAGRAGVTGWTGFFGRVWEAYVRHLLERSVGGIGRLVPERVLKEEWPNEKICDNVVVYPTRLLLVEAVSHRMTVQTVALGGPEDLQRDIEAAILEKAQQLASTITLLETRRESVSSHIGNDVHAYLPVIALPGPFPPMPPLIAAVRDQLRSDPECAPLFDPGVVPLVVLDAADLELLLGTAAAAGSDMTQLLLDWQASALALVDFRSWAQAVRGVEARLPDWMIESAKRFTDHSRETLFRA